MQALPGPRPYLDCPEHPPTGTRQRFLDECDTPTTWGGRSAVREGEQFHIRDVKEGGASRLATVEATLVWRTQEDSNLQPPDS